MSIQNEMLSKLKLREQILIVLCACLLVAAGCFAQESGAKPVPNAASSAAAASAPGGPASALSSVLAAACSQNLTAAYSKLDYAKSKGYSAKAEWAKGEAVLAEAKGEQEAKHYDTCVAKVKEAEPHIEASLK